MMFYEEMMIDGEWHYRTTPDGEWRKGRKSAKNPAPISVERFDHNWKSDSDGWPISYMEPFRYGEYVRHSDYVALLQQLAEREAEVERLSGRAENAEAQIQDAWRELACSDDISALLIAEGINQLQRAREAAERAREEIEAAMAWYFDHSGHVVRMNGRWSAITGRDELTQFDDGISAIVAAFLVASGGDNESR